MTTKTSEVSMIGRKPLDYLEADIKKQQASFPELTKTAHDWRYATAKSAQAFCSKCGRWETAYTASRSCEEMRSASRSISETLAKELEVENAR